MIIHGHVGLGGCVFGIMGSLTPSSLLLGVNLTPNS